MSDQLWLFAYEMDAGPLGNIWEVYTDGMGYVLSVPADNFGEWLDIARANDYDVLVNTMESWLEYESSGNANAV